MIEDLLRLRFPSDYGLDTAKVNVPLSTQSESNTEPERNNPLSNMGAFCQTPSAMSGTLEYQPYKGFVFIQVKYPAEYQW